MMETRRSRLAYKQAKLVVFDFDGVIVDSNGSKFDCFLELAAPFGPEAIARLNAFLSERPYATRFEVVESILESEEAGDAISEDELLCRFSECSKSRILKLQVTPALSALREADSRDWALVSATEEQDMQELARGLGIDNYFQAGIFGSPTTKVKHIRELSEAYGLSGSEMVLFGDRVSDFQATMQAGIGFIFVSKWSDASKGDLKELESCLSVPALSDLLLGSGKAQ